MRAPVVPPAALKAISHYVIDLRICNETLRVGRIVKIGLTTDYAPCWPFPRLRHPGNGGDRKRPAPPPVGMRAFASPVRRCAGTWTGLYRPPRLVSPSFCRCRRHFFLLESVPSNLHQLPCCYGIPRLGGPAIRKSLATPPPERSGPSRSAQCAIRCGVANVGNIRSPKLLSSGVVLPC